MNKVIDKKDFVFYNKYGDKLQYGSIIYYPIRCMKSHNIQIISSKLEAFAFVRGGPNKEITPMILTRAYLLNLDDVRKTYDDAEEVIRKWEEKIVRKLEQAIQY